MSTYALQTKTMLQPVSPSPVKLLGQSSRCDELSSQLPSKRKRDDVCRLGSSNRPFSIRPYPGSLYSKPASFKPVRVIARSQLPLTFLDTTPDDRFATNSLFMARVNVLEQNIREEGVRYPVVLLAQLETTKTLYAVERVQEHVYSLCKLANWLKEKDLESLWDPSKIDVLSIASVQNRSAVSAGVWWQHAAVDTHPRSHPAKRVKSTMMRPRPQYTDSDMTAGNSFSDTAGYDRTTAVSAVSIEGPVESLEPLPLPEEQLSSLVQQYLDAVYLSKTSLAYFAKGPLTRVRNAFTSPEEGAPQTHELIAFLRTMLLSPKASEKKYYERLPSLVKALPPGSFSDEESFAVSSRPKKSKKKTKPNKDGVYPQEETFVKRWWWSDVSNGDSVGLETIDQRTKRRIGELRVRETLAQLMLMLEIIALESLSSHAPPVDKQTAEGDSQVQSKKRRKKLGDINVQLDLVLDKLCIWHATEEAGILDFDVKSSKEAEHIDMNAKNGGSDRLHSFCVEVIVPFYVNRIPEQAVMVNKKLGGPAHQLPSKRKAMRPPMTSRKSGSSNELEVKKSRRSLARVATDNTGKTGERVTPSLNRSATDSALLSGIKREGSEVPLSAIPFRRSPSKDSRRSVSQVRHLQGRQIDFAQPSAATTAKIKQKQRVEEDLQDAILALKKPNRGLVAGSYVADIEQRGLGLTNKSRKPANPVRRIVKEVQVSATPRVGRRTKNMIEQTPTQDENNPFVRNTSEASSSSTFRILSSGVKPSSSMVPATGHCSAAAGRSLVHTGIAETPSKAPNTKSFSSGAARRTIFATPPKGVVPFVYGGPSADSHIFETPVKANGTLQRPKLNFDIPTVEATPIKTTPRISSVPDPFKTAVPTKEDNGLSIYDALGWNDDDDDDVA